MDPTWWTERPDPCGALTGGQQSRGCRAVRLRGPGPRSLGRLSPAVASWYRQHELASTTRRTPFGADGPFKGFHDSIAGSSWADRLFMLGLAAIGNALILGIAMRIASAAGTLLVVMMWTVVLPRRTTRSWTTT